MGLLMFLNKKNLTIFVKFFFTMGIFIYLFKILNFNLLLMGLKKISAKYICLVAIACLLSSLCQALRWCYLTRGHINSSAKQQVLLFWKANFFNLITPASVGGDIYRIVNFNKKNRGTIAFGLIFKERFIGLFGIFLCYLISLILYFNFTNSTQHHPAFFTLLGIFSLLGLLALIIMQICLPLIAKKSAYLFSRKWKKKIILFSKAFRYKSIFELLILILLTVCSTGCWVLVFFILTQAMVASFISIGELGIVSLITELTRWIPITMQGIGMREGAAAFAFQSLGHPFELGFLIAGLAYLINTLVLIFVGMMSFLSKFHPAEAENFT